MPRVFMILLAAVLLMGNSYSERALELSDQGKGAEAFAVLKEGAAMGDRDAITGLASFHDEGRFVAQDRAEAARLYRQAADAGHPYAQWRLGELIDLELTPGTIDEAIRLLNASADQGFPAALVSLGNIYATGHHVPKDFSKAHYYYDLAARAGFYRGFYELGALYANGDGIPADRERGCAYRFVSFIVRYGGEPSRSDVEKFLAPCLSSMDEGAWKRIVGISEEIVLEYRPPLPGVPAAEKP